MWKSVLYMKFVDINQEKKKDWTSSVLNSNSVKDTAIETLYFRKDNAIKAFLPKARLQDGEGNFLE